MLLAVLGKDGGFPRPGGACSGYLVESGEAAVAVDLGAGTLSRLLTRLPVAKLDALVLSHLHFDHCSDALVLRYAVEAERRSGRRDGTLPVYLPETPAEVRTLFDSATEAFSVHTLADGLHEQIGGLDFRFFAGRHAVESYGMRITDAEGASLAYTGDTGRFDGLAAACADADALLADVTFLHARDGETELPHLTTTQAAALAKASRVGRLYCTHLSDDAEIAQKVAEEVDFTPTTVVKDMGQYEVLKV